MPDTNGAPDAPRGSLPHDAVVSHRYVVQNMLGRGGMGYVYRVFDSARGHDVALKQLRFSRAPTPSLASARLRAEGRRSLRNVDEDDGRREQRLELFQREYHTLAELAHPRIIEAYDYGWDQGVPYYTMELLTGRDISELAPSPWPRVCGVLRDVASALTLLHSRRLLHRDISPSNVHQQKDGFCKLIDFGAMGNMGKPTAIVGTPQFMPPELLRQQPLDARSDLYSLAALGYFLLTGRSVHPVRSVAELYNFLEMRPKPASAYAMGTPRALDALLLQMLSPDVAARPSSTIELLERLGAIDGVEHGSAKRSLPTSVSTPGLIGRHAELKLVRRRLSLALRGKGSSLLVAGPAGSGRSRFLDACVLEGRLSGARVLKSAADTSAATPYGVISTLLRQLWASFGSWERAELTLPEDLARRLMPQATQTSATAAALPRASSAAAELSETDWTPVHAQVLAYLSSVAERRCVMLTIDDFERVDAASATLITALAQRADSDNLVVVAAIDPDARNALDAVRQFKACARELTLVSLTLSETELLLESVFGEVPNLAPLARRLHGLSGGNPRLIMELAQHLVDASVIRCESGGYLLPEVISSQDLPTSLGEALRARVRRLSEDAQALAATLAVCSGIELSAEQAFDISELSHEARGVAALSELSAANIAEQRGPNVTLRQPAMATALTSALPSAERRALHARVATRLVLEPGRGVHAADHFFRAELPSEAVDALLSATASTYGGRTWHAGYSSLIERGLAACARFGRPARDAFTLQNALVLQVLGYTEPCDLEQLLSFCRALCRMSGLTDWHEIGEEDESPLSASERLSEALRRAESRYQATPEHQRILPPAAAIRHLVSYVTRLSGFASTTYELTLLNALPSLAPYAPLSPTISVAEELVTGLRELRGGHVDKYLARITRLTVRLGEPDCAGFPAPEARSFVVNLLYGLGLANGALGRPEAFDHALDMEAVPSQRINAWRVRQIAHLFHCDPTAAESCRREVELLQMQEATRQFHQGGTVETESLAYLQADDLLGLRRALPALEEMAARHEGWRPLLLVRRAALQRLRGRPAEALGLSELALQMLPAAKHHVWGNAAGVQLQALLDLGRAEEAMALGESYVRCAEAQGWVLGRHIFELPLSDAEATLGHFDRARTRVERMLAEDDALGIQGLHRGILHEAAARHAVLAKDATGFAHAWALCKECLRYGQNPGVTARLDRLFDTARAASLATESSPSDDRHALSVERIHAQLLACEGEARGAEALQLLMTLTAASAGHLFLVTDHCLSTLASFSALPPPAYLQDFLLRYLQTAEVVSDQTVDITYETSLVETDATLEPLLLTCTRAGQRLVVAVAALSFASGRRWPDPKLLEAVADNLAAR